MDIRGFGFERRIVAASVAAACAWLGSESAWAASDHTVTINAVVTGKCTFNTPSSTVVLTIDPTVSANVTAPASILYRCTRGTTPGFAHASASTGSGTGGRLTAGTEGFAYSYSSSGATAGGGLGAGQDRTHVLTITVDQSLAANVTPATYTDTITVTVNP